MITVIISTYNHGIYLKTAIAAISNQNDLVTRIVVINDGSIDDTYNILEDLKENDDRLIVVNNNSNVGMVNGFKMGLEYVNTEFFAFAPADDFLLPNWAMSSINVMRAFPLSALCLSNTYIKNVESNLVVKTVTPKSITGRYLDPISFEKALLKFGVWFSSNAVLFRTAKFDDAFYKNDAGSLSDLLLISGLGLRFGVAVSDEYLGCFHNRTNSVSNSVASTNTAFELLSILANHLYRSDISIYFSKRVANRLYLRSYYICLFEQLQYLFNGYRKSLRELPNQTQARLISISFRWIFYILKLGLVILIKPGSILKLTTFRGQKASISEVDFIDSYETRMSNQYGPSV